MFESTHKPYNVQFLVHIPIILLAILIIGWAAQFSTGDEGGAADLQIVASTYYIDTSEQKTIDDAIKDDSWINHGFKYTSSFGRTPHPVWVKMVIHNPKQHKESWIFNMQDIVAEKTRIYQANTDGEFSLIYDRMSLGEKKPTLHSHNTSVRISLAGKEQAILYLHYQTLTHLHFHTDFLTEDKFNAEAIKYFYWLGAILAILATVALFNYILYFSLNRNYYLYYSLQQLSSIVYILAHDHLLPQSAWVTVNYPKILLTTTCLALCFGLLFSRGFLDIKEMYPRLDKVFPGIIAVVFSAIPLILFDYFQLTIFKYLLPPVIIFAASIPIVVSIHQILRGRRYVIPYCIGMLSFIASFIIYMCVALEIFILDLGSHTIILHVGLVIEALMLSMSMSLRVADVRKKNDNSMRQLFDVYRERLVEAQELQQLVEARTIAVQDKIKKSVHLASASHDIGHHLFLMKLNLNELSVGKKNEDAINSMSQAIKYLEDITDDILSVSRVDVIQKTGQVNFEQLFSGLHSSLLPLAQKKRVTLRYRSSAVVDSASQVILKRILENLIRNAIQYTNYGGVFFGIRHSKDAFRIYVYDTGPGIPETEQRYLSKAFERGGMVNGEGHGLGLYIAKTLCHQAGYSLEMKTKKDRGTVFIVGISRKNDYL